MGLIGRKRAYLGLVFLLILNSCIETKNEYYLNMAEECFYTIPDSARFYLKQVDSPEKMQPENQAKWILLTWRLNLEGTALQIEEDIIFDNILRKGLLTDNNKSLQIQNRQYLILLSISVCVLVVIFFCYQVKSKQNKGLLLQREKALEEHSQTVSSYVVSSTKGLEIYRRMAILALSPQASRHMKLLENYNQIVHNSKSVFRFKWKVYEQLLNFAYPNFKEKLLRKCPVLNSREIQIILLRKGGFSIQEVSMLLRLSIHTVYRANSNIRKKYGISETQSIVSFITEKLQFTD